MYIEYAFFTTFRDCTIKIERLVIFLTAYSVLSLFLSKIIDETNRRLCEYCAHDAKIVRITENFESHVMVWLSIVLFVLFGVYLFVFYLQLLRIVRMASDLEFKYTYLLSHLAYIPIMIVFPISIFFYYLLDLMDFNFGTFVVVGGFVFFPFVLSTPIMIEVLKHSKSFQRIANANYG